MATENKVDSSTKNTNNANNASSSSRMNFDNLYNYSYGLVIGAGIGDSIGSYLEFSSGNSLDEVIDFAMTMPGGGTWGQRVKSGQITDDTELAISLCRGIVHMINHQNDIRNDNKSCNTPKNEQIFGVNNNNNNNNNIDHIYDSHYAAKQYKKWYDSHPFDMGGCTAFTIGEAPYIDRMKRAAFDYDDQMKRQYNGSLGNLANGSLMRCMPLIVYGYKLNYKHLYNIMMEDSSLTHSNNIVVIANTMYAISAQYLLTHYDDDDDDDDNDNNNNDNNKDEEKKNDKTNDSERNIMAILKAEQWLKGEIEINDDKEDINRDYKEVYKWLIDCKQNDISKLQTATKFIGFVKIGFQRAFYHLWNKNKFETAMKITISEGGDTDTNCCIVGGLMGAYWGYNKIPKLFTDKIMCCKPAVPSRDNKFQTKLYLNDKYIQHIIQNAPDTLQVKIYQMVQCLDDDDDDDDENEDEVELINDDEDGI